MSHFATRTVLSFACVALIASACDGSGGSPLGADLMSSSKSLAVRQANDGMVTLRIVADSSSPRRFYFGDRVTPGGFADASTRLATARQTRPDEATLYVYTYPGAAGFDVIRVLNRAKNLGFKQVNGVADYSDDSSPIAQVTWKRWQEDLQAMRTVHASDSLANTRTPRR